MVSARTSLPARAAPLRVLPTSWLQHSAVPLRTAREEKYDRMRAAFDAIAAESTSLDELVCRIKLAEAKPAQGWTTAPACALPALAITTDAACDLNIFAEDSNPENELDAACDLLGVVRCARLRDDAVPASAAAPRGAAAPPELGRRAALVTTLTHAAPAALVRQELHLPSGIETNEVGSDNQPPTPARRISKDKYTAKEDAALRVLVPLFRVPVTKKHRNGFDFAGVNRLVLGGDDLRFACLRHHVRNVASKTLRKRYLRYLQPEAQCNKKRIWS